MQELRSIYGKWLDHRNINDVNRWNCERGFDTLINNIKKCSDEVEKQKKLKRLRERPHEKEGAAAGARVSARKPSPSPIVKSNIFRGNHHASIEQKIPTLLKHPNLQHLPDAELHRGESAQEQQKQAPSAQIGCQDIMIYQPQQNI